MVIWEIGQKQKITKQERAYRTFTKQKLLQQFCYCIKMTEYEKQET